MTLAEAVGAACGSAVCDTRRVAGGSLNEAWAITLADGRALFVKTRTDVAAGEFAAEAAGLEWLGEAIAVPAVVAVDDRFLVLEQIAPGVLDAAGQETFGRALAAMHGLGAPAFGFSPTGGPLRLGEVVAPNDSYLPWPQFYAHNRLLALLPMAGLSAAGARDVETVCAGIDALAGPRERVSRVHGDLWTGNVLAGADGVVRVIDPVAHGGHREVDLAMLRMFGSVPQRVFDAYDEVWPLAEGHAERIGLWQLFPLLVHAARFGGGYVAQAEAVAELYAARVPR